MPGLINPWVLLALVIGWLASVAGAGWGAYGLGRDAEVAAQARDDKAVARGAEAAASAAAGAIAKLEIKHVTVRQQLEREVQTREVYRDCRSGMDAVRLLNSTRPDATDGPEPAGGGQLPAASSPAG